MSAQLALTLPAYRRSDPESSAVAAASVAGAQQQSECRAILEVLRAAKFPMTYREVHAALAGRIAEPVEVMRRLDNLRTDKLVRSIATFKRRCSVSGKLVQTWVAA